MLTLRVCVGYRTRISSVFFENVAMRVLMVSSLSSARTSVDCAARCMIRATIVSCVRNKYSIIQFHRNFGYQLLHSCIQSTGSNQQVL